ncbi:Zn-dependent peptidase ImmA (M78 family) [Rhizobium skierniewicense]|uniref:Zn-dependent peptidase ImmA (M78 family) n=1 Tax=Rhizobium skierniewicense TaxID=984260 RepID=A0A7W6C4I8_9HYPH|nr:hypothetical protein [Rhizobium skierniewicense]MBB3944666.1 Zn-dependent peptidase ImmA (M78 family) [Rhizobium skierniewicense]
MIISGDKAHEAFKKIHHVREEYATYVNGANLNCISVEDLYSVVSTMYEIKITKKGVTFEGNFLRGLMERYAKEVIIRVRMNQTDDWLRFTAVKELCHVIIDEREDWSVDGVRTIEDLLIEYFANIGDVAKGVSQSEMLAEIAALELLYPYECREHDIARLAKKETSLIKIASYHRVPTAMISRALDSYYHVSVAGPIWKQIVE